MSNKIQFKRGIDAARGTVVLASGEPGWATDTKKLFVGDGATYGGIDIADAAKTTSGTFGAARIPTLPNLKGTLTDEQIPNLETLSYGAAFATTQIPNLPTSKITSGTLAVARHQTLNNLNGTVDLDQIPTMDDGHIPNLEGLSYGAAFATTQIPNLPTSKITSGTLAVARHQTLNNLNGTVDLVQIPTMDDGHIPSLETLTGGAFATAQIPSIGAYKVASGTFNVNRIPVLPTNRYGSAVLLSGDQTIGGTKTFGDIPILPASDPTTANQAARKAYVDAAGGGGIGTHANEYHNPDMLCVDNSNSMQGTLSMGSHPISGVSRFSFGAYDVGMLGTATNVLYFTDKAGGLFCNIYANWVNAKMGLMVEGTTSFEGHPVLDVPIPTGGSHGVNKNYVDDHVWAANDITSGTLAVARHQTLNNLNGTVDLVQIPTMDDGHIPDVDGLSYSGAFATTQIPDIDGGTF